MILYMILDRRTREPVKTSYKRYSVFNSYRDASIALSAGLKPSQWQPITPEQRAALDEQYAIVSFDTNRLPVEANEQQVLARTVTEQEEEEQGVLVELFDLDHRHMLP
jgi:hypothetical protein